MAEYRAELPPRADMETVTALREVGAVRFTFVVEADSRRSAIRDLTAEYEWRGLGRKWWDRHLSGRRGQGGADRG